MQSSRNYWKFPLFSGKAVAGVELNGEINKVVWLMLNLLCREGTPFSTICMQPFRFDKPKGHFFALQLMI